MQSGRSRFGQLPCSSGSKKRQDANRQMRRRCWTSSWSWLLRSTGQGVTDDAHLNSVQDRCSPSVSKDRPSFEIEARRAGCRPNVWRSTIVCFRLQGTKLPFKEIFTQPINEKLLYDMRSDCGHRPHSSCH